jgi:hypothetical protein
MFKKGDKVRFTRVNPNGGEKYGKEGDVATVLVPDTGYSHDYKSNQVEVYLPGCDIEPSVPWSSLELISDSPIRAAAVLTALAGALRDGS